MARLTVWLLGFEVFTISNDEPTEVEDDGAALNGGTLAAYPINVAWRPGQGMDHDPESPYEDE